MIDNMKYLAEDEVVGADHQQVAVHLLVDLLLHPAFKIPLTQEQKALSKLIMTILSARWMASLYTIIINQNFLRGKALSSSLQLEPFAYLS